MPFVWAATLAVASGALCVLGRSVEVGASGKKHLCNCIGTILTGRYGDKTSHSGCHRSEYYRSGRTFNPHFNPRAFRRNGPQFHTTHVTWLHKPHWSIWTLWTTGPDPHPIQLNRQTKRSEWWCDCAWRAGAGEACRSIASWPLMRAPRATAGISRSYALHSTLLHPIPTTNNLYILIASSAPTIPLRLKMASRNCGSTTTACGTGCP